MKRNSFFLVHVLLPLFFFTAQAVRMKKKRVEVTPETTQEEVIDLLHESEDDETTTVYTKEKKEDASKYFSIDGVTVIIYGPERTRVVCETEVDRMTLDGRHRTLDDLIIEELLYQETLKYEIPIDESVIDKYIMGICKQHNLSMDDIRVIFKNSGFSEREGREQLRLMYAANSMIEYKITSRLMVPEDDVIKFYNDHPQYEEPAYTLKRAFVPHESGVSIKEMKQKIKTALKTGKGFSFNWGDPFVLRENEIAPVMNFIVSMKSGDVSQPIQSSGGFELYKLVSKKPRIKVSLEKRYKEIVDRLRMPRFNSELEKYKKSLLDNATIVHVNDQKKSTTTS